MSFSPGKPLLAMLVLGLAGAALLWRQAEPQPADLRVWVFAPSHAATLREPGAKGAPSLVEQYQQKAGLTVGVDLILSRALDVRLLSRFMSQSLAEPLPDLVEIEINSVGKYLRPPVDEVGFHPLNELLQALPPEQQLLPSRLAPWTKQGTVFGIPHDVHPTAIVYRTDLFEQAGEDPRRARTWEAFWQMGLRCQERWSQDGMPQRRTIELARSAPDQLLMMLMQRHINLLDDQNRVFLADEKVVQTMAMYALLVAGEKAIGGQSSSSGALWTRALADGRIASAICADWRLSDLKSYAPELAGKLAVMPMPVFEPGDAPCATWGGTMIGIPRHARDVKRSWELLRHLYLSDKAMSARQQHTDILPPVMSAWEDAAYQRPDAYFGGQQVQLFYVELARKLPQRYVTPFTLMASQQLAAVLSRAVDHAGRHGEAGLEDQCRAWLGKAAEELSRRVRFGQFDAEERQ